MQELMPGNATSPDALRDAARRRWLYGSVAGTAALAGLALAWWRRPAFGRSPEMEALWKLRLEATDQSVVAMQSFAGKPLLVNFWATWCPPCVEELPLLDRFYQQKSANGWQVLGIAADKLTAVKAFLEKTPVRFPVGLAGMEAIALSKSVGNDGGSLPFTVVLDSAGDIVHRKIGRVSAEDLDSWSKPG